MWLGIKWSKLRQAMVTIEVLEGTNELFGNVVWLQLRNWALSE